MTMLQMPSRRVRYPLDYQECRAEGVLIFLIDLTEDHAGYMAELIFQCGKDHFTAGALAADNESRGSNTGAVAQPFDVPAGNVTAVKAWAQLGHDMPAWVEADRLYSSFIISQSVWGIRRSSHRQGKWGSNTLGV